MKGLSCINRTIAILKSRSPVPDLLQQITTIIPEGWQYPEYTVVRIRYDGQRYLSPRFKETEWRLTSQFETIEKKKGTIEVYYLAPFAENDNDPFLSEEKLLLDELAHILCSHLNSRFGRKVKDLHTVNIVDSLKVDGGETYSISRQMLRRLLNRHNSNRDIFHDMMPFKVTEIL